VPLNESERFCGIEISTGMAYEKKLRSAQKLSPMGKGSRLRLTINVPQRELVIEQLKDHSQEVHI